ncbi:hypothetical protein [Vibrio sp. SCSIO 43137]|uniref:hypothetical protein n=1 Tax=Vibrio sp. SCSIO 43137 TaxID=3021011 RepID=UPI0023080053|nr:hypothetical protein [Vibrio sp. SCSIO 43137]WCE29963.1 hypothetical protein PK654_01225 [Vibrio sp. SCSIO 43137]
MSKYTNPVRGQVPCPVCTKTATVHQVGEGKLIAEGEPLKNGRNLGLLYYRCPDCGNSSISKSVNQYIETALNVEISVEDENPTVSEALEGSVESAALTETVIEHEASADKVGSVEPTESQKEDKPARTGLSPLVKRVFIGLVILLALIWAARRLLPKKSEERGGDDVATA